MASPKIILVTGGNTGIGYETVKVLLESDQAYHIIVGSRSLDRGTAAIDNLRKEYPSSASKLELVQLDLTSDESIQKTHDQVESNYGRLDILVNNAGAAYDVNKPDHTLRECFNLAYDVNVSGTHVLTYTFIPLLLKSSDPRLLFVAGLSQMTVAAQKYFPTPPLPAGWPKFVAFETIPYRCSKTALNMLILDWNHKLQADGVKVWGVGPGILATDLGGMDKEILKEMGAGDPRQGGEVIVSVVEGKRDDEAGKLVDKDGIIPF